MKFNLFLLLLATLIAAVSAGLPPFSLVRIQSEINTDLFWEAKDGKIALTKSGSLWQVTETNGNYQISPDDNHNLAVQYNGVNSDFTLNSISPGNPDQRFQFEPEPALNKGLAIRSVQDPNSYASTSPSSCTGTSNCHDTYISAKTGDNRKQWVLRGFENF
ncbi:hypothetical protein C1645_849235 [Glomus cerebriforme]|uniref:Ricin B lectin domain-containing protein n=1 Tax=Glomus cerebriforme TaxID=658196 RepID=A0A397S066_9GLOM|nr:hypothetical protein C1645_849235 [Glomus cerebriforme]